MPQPILSSRQDFTLAQLTHHHKGLVEESVPVCQLSSQTEDSLTIHVESILRLTKVSKDSFALLFGTLVKILLEFLKNFLRVPISKSLS